MAYGKYLNTVSEKFSRLVDEIQVEYNFDNGDEFEIALCKAFRSILPSKYGVCRGFVVTLDGQKKGDDIIIFDQDRFPTLRLLEDNTYAQKQQIPVEAVYAYIEAKNILCIEEDGGQSIRKALKQVSDIKKLQREQVPLNRIGNTNFGENMKVEGRNNWPQYKNPIYTAIIANGARSKEGGKCLEGDKISPALIEEFKKIDISDKIFPDLIIIGKDNICLPVICNKLISPFYINGKSQLATFYRENLCFGIGISSMFYALDSIELGSVSWTQVLAEGLGIGFN